MHDIATQLVLKWPRMGSDYRNQVTSDFTRLTLETIALCAMDFRFNSFYSDDMHPFIQAMTNSLKSGTVPSSVIGILNSSGGAGRASVEADRKLRELIFSQMVQHRRDNLTSKKGLLNAMVHGKDPRTGANMRDELISANMVTFLITGYETTSGLLSFAFLNLLKNPAAYFPARKEVDEVVGRGKVKAEQSKNVKYFNVVSRETLRLKPTAPALFRQPREEIYDTPSTIGGRLINKDARILVLISKSQRDPELYGEDANEFGPERLLDGNFEKLPKSAWKTIRNWRTSLHWTALRMAGGTTCHRYDATAF